MRSRADLAPKARHQGLDGVAFRLVMSVDMLDQLSLRDDAIPVMREIAQQPEFQRRQFDRPAIHQHAEAPRVDAEPADLDQRRDMPADTAQEPSQSRKQFFHFEGLGEVVVGSGIDAFDLLEPGASRRQHEDRNDTALAAQSAHDGQTIELRKAEIEDHGVVVFRRCAKPAVLAVDGYVHHIAGFPQRTFDVVGDRLFVFYHQDPHQRLRTSRI